jgi:hypothetical protein
MGTTAATAAATAATATERRVSVRAQQQQRQRCQQQELLQLLTAVHTLQYATARHLLTVGHCHLPLL